MQVEVIVAAVVAQAVLVRRVNELIAAGCDALAADANGNTAMHFAIVKGILDDVAKV